MLLGSRATCFFFFCYAYSIYTLTFVRHTDDAVAHLSFYLTDSITPLNHLQASHATNEHILCRRFSFDIEGMSKLDDVRDLPRTLRPSTSLLAKKGLLVITSVFLSGTQCGLICAVLLHDLVLLLTILQQF